MSRRTERQGRAFLRGLFVPFWLMLVLPSLVWGDWEEVTDVVEVRLTRPFYNFTAGISYFNASLGNNADVAYSAPVRLVVDWISPPEVTVRNAHGLTDGGLPYYDFGNRLGDNYLDPGEVSAALEIELDNPRRLRFNIGFAVAVANTNDPPAITSTPVPTAAEDELYSYDVEAIDPDAGDTLTYTLDAGAPAGMTIDSATGLIGWTPTNDQVGDNAVTVRVTDAGGLDDSQTFTIVVDDVNEAPSITSTAVTGATQDTPYSYDVEATDPDVGDTLTYTLDAGAPAGMTIDSATGLIGWTPGNAQVGDNAVTVQVTDAGGLDDSQTFTIAVVDVNEAPSITSTAVTGATQDTPYSYDVEATDPDAGDSLTFSLDTDTPPSGMSIDSASGLISWTPTNAQVGDNAVTVRVTDTGGLFDTQGFTIGVAAFTLESLSVSPASLTLTSASTTRQLTVTGTYSNGNNKDITTTATGTTYTSSNTNVSTVDVDGLVTAQGNGTCTITASNGGLSANTIVGVVLPTSTGAGLVLGEGYDDTLGLPLEGFTATLLEEGGSPLPEPAPAVVAGTDGRFSMELNAGESLFRYTKEGFTPVIRHGSMGPDTTVVLFDARLTPLDGKVNTIEALYGGTARDEKERVGLRFPAGLPDQNLAVRLTPVSGQGLQGRLPLGWSPAYTLDIAPHDLAFGGYATLRVPNEQDIPALAPVILAAWDSTQHLWVAQSPGVVTEDGAWIEAGIDGAGQYSLVVPDNPPTAPPAATPGQPLPSTQPIAIPEGMSAEGQVVPAVTVPGKGPLGIASVKVTADRQLPSGTAVQAAVSEEFNLLTQEQLSPEPFTQDIVLYAGRGVDAPPALEASFPVTPSKDFGLGILALGRVRLDIQTAERELPDYIVGAAGRELVLPDDLTLTIPPGALNRNTAVGFARIDAADIRVMLPPGYAFRSAMHLDLAGAALAKPATVAFIPRDPPASGAYLIVARVEEWDNDSRLIFVGLARFVAGSMETIPSLDGIVFPGIDGEGRYLFLEPDQPFGLVHGTVSNPDGSPAASAVISVDTSPLLSPTTETGGYLVSAAVGQFVLSATDTNTRDLGSASGSIIAVLGSSRLDVQILPTPPWVVSVTPEDGALNVPVDSTVVVSFSEPVANVDGDTLRLLGPGDQPVDTGITLSIDRTLATLSPHENLGSETRYSLTASAQILDDAGYGLDSFAPSFFTTEDTTPPEATGEITLSLPDERGYAIVTGAPGAIEPENSINIFNYSNGFIASLAPNPDGSFSAAVLAEIGDDVVILVQDPAGNSSMIDPGPFIDEATGAVVIDEEGGTVFGPNGERLEIPAGALDQAAVVRLLAVEEPFELPADVLDDPELVARFEESYQPVAAVRIDTGGVEFVRPVDLSLPAPPGAALGDSFVVVQEAEIDLGGAYYDVATDALTEHPSNVLRRFGVVDMATVKEIDGELRMSTDSPPFHGIFGVAASRTGSLIRYFAPVVAVGVVQGRVVRRVTDIDGAVNYYPVEGAIVRLFGDQSVAVYYTETGADGKFVISAITTMGLYDQRQLSLLVTDPLSGITQQRRMGINLQSQPFAATYPDWNVVSAAILSQDFVLESEKRIRTDQTPPTIDIAFDGKTLVDYVIEEGDKLTIYIRVSDNRTSPADILIRLEINDQPQSLICFSNEEYPDSCVYTREPIESGKHVIKVTAWDGVVDENDLPRPNEAAVTRLILVKKPGAIPGAVEGPPLLLALKYNLAGEDQKVDINTNVSLSFNEPINTDTVNEDTLSLLLIDRATGELGEPVPGRFVFTDYNSTVTFIPFQSLQYGQEYAVQVKYEVLPDGSVDGMLDTEGLPVILDPLVTFETILPKLLSLYPMSDAKDLAMQLIPATTTETKRVYAFVTDTDRSNPTGMTVVDFSDPEADFYDSETDLLDPDLSKTVPLRPDSYSSYGVAINGNYAYVITVGGVISGTYTLLSTLQVWDISDPLNPTKVTFLPLTTVTSLAGTIPYRLVLSGGYLYVSMLNSGFKVFDLQNPASPYPVMNVVTADPRHGAGQASDIAIRGDYVFVANGPTGELLVFDIADIWDVVTDPPAGKLDLGDYVSGGNPNTYRIKLIENVRVLHDGVPTYKNLALVALLEKGLTIVDVTEPEYPKWLHTWFHPPDTPGRVIGLDADRENGIIVLSDSSGGLHILDIHGMELEDDPSLPWGYRARAASISDLGSFDLGASTRGGGILLDDGLVYVTTSKGVQAVELPYRSRFLGPSCREQTPMGCVGRCCGATNSGNSEVGYKSGSLKLHHYCPAMSFLGVSNAVGFTYSSTAAYPGTVIAAETDPVLSSEPPDRLSFKVEIAGIEKEASFEPGQVETRQAFLFDGKDDQGERLPTGSYPYRMTVSRHYGASALPTRIEGRALIVNEIESPFGAGWMLKGLQRLHPAADGTLTLTGGWGGAMYFTPAEILGAGGIRYASPGTDSSELVRNFDGTYTRTLKGGTKIYFDGTGLMTAIVDRNGNRLDYLYDSTRLTRITNSGGQQTLFSYDGSRHLNAVTDPTGRMTRFIVDSNGDLARITNPDGSFKTYTYEDHLLTAKTDPRGHATQYEYDEHGRVDKTIAPTGEMRQFTPSAVQGLINDLEVLGSGTPEDPAPSSLVPGDVFVDGKGHTTGLKTDRAGRILERKDPLGNTTLYQRDYESAQGSPTKIVRPNGAVSTMAYDAKGNLLTRSERSTGATMRFEYDPEFSQVLRTTNPKGNETGIEYDDRGNPIGITDALGNSTTMEYDDRGLLTRVTDALGNPTNFVYDNVGNVLTTTNPLGYVTSYTYDGAGNVLSVVDAGGHTTAHTYDDMNRVLTVTDANENVTRYGYDEKGNITEVTDAKGQAASLEYNEIDQIVRAVSPSGLEKVFTYDSNRNLIGSSDGTGGVSAYAYDEGNRLKKKTLPGDVITDYARDSVGNVLSMTDPNGNAVSYSYDLENRLRSRTASPDGTENHTTNFTYDNTGNLTTVINARGNRVAHEHDTIDRLKLVRYPDGSEEKYSYDEVGNIQKTLDRSGRETLYEYDVVGNLTKKIYVGTGTAIEYEYDRLGNLISVADDRGPTAYEYNSLNRITKVIYPEGETISYEYDELGNRSKMIDPAGNVLVYLYDTDNRLREINEVVGGNDQLVVRYVYEEDGSGRLVRKELGNGVYTAYEYDESDRVIRLENSENDGEVISSFTYEYDTDGNILTKSYQGRESEYTDSYTYDAKNQLTHVTYSDAKSNITYGYDSVGNRLSETVDALLIEYVTNNMDQYTEVDGIGVTYDSNGNLHSDSTNTYTFGIDNQLLAVKTPLAVFEYDYDAFGRRISQYDGAELVRYIYDGNQIVSEVSADGSERKSYVFGPEADSIYRMRSDGGTYFFLRDALGNVTEVLDGNGEVVESYRYDAFGRPDKNSSIGNNFFAGGKEYDRLANLYYYRARYYHPDLGRFISVDPIQSGYGWNDYAYVLNNPFRFSDPDGAKPRDIINNIDLVWVEPAADSIAYTEAEGSPRILEVEINLGTWGGWPLFVCRLDISAAICSPKLSGVSVSASPGGSTVSAELPLCPFGGAKFDWERTWYGQSELLAGGYLGVPKVGNVSMQLGTKEMHAKMAVNAPIVSASATVREASGMSRFFRDLEKWITSGKLYRDLGLQ